MIGYSKFSNSGTPRSNSMDFSSLSTYSDLKTRKLLIESQETDQMKNPSTPKIINTARDYSLAVAEEDQEGNDERFNNGKLRRNSSAVLQFSVRRGFSMGKSSSVSERYRRIHGRPVTVASPVHDDEESVLTTMETTTRSVKKRHTKGRILKACKRLFGL